jgi:hypothetical protein
LKKKQQDGEPLTPTRWCFHKTVTDGKEGSIVAGEEGSIVKRMKRTNKIPINIKVTFDPCLWRPERRREIVCAEV